ncbi:hypothetical protein BDEG_20393 [Batrachochytrium dendrobatidis JEL423]|uniref:Anaphase-promoting complex subunit 4 WD40 domain-containing protein n=1 Tax=Batrachochytrium dendrobatidis (strain JEL423) TaxID=403673 RepID=A0A177W7W4_BATDL|nr:hypothetical protein BDEG_20393 [Batrachochytrium dendrobatidis JEL423]
MLTAKLAGHTEPVSALTQSLQSSIIASASEDSTVRIWDMTTLQTTKILYPPTPQSSPTTKVDSCSDDDECDGPVAISFAANSPNLIFAAVGSSLVLGDLRLNGASNSWQQLFSASENINKISVHSNELHVGLADDSGSVYVLETAKIPYKPYRKIHCDQRVLSTKKVMGDMVWQYGLFYPLVQPNLAADNPFAQGLNPPFVYDTAFNSMGNTFIAALGDGSIDWMHWPTTKSQSRSTRKTKQAQYIQERLVGPHAWSVTSVSFENGNDKPNMFVSGCIDGSVALWNLQNATNGFTTDELETHAPKSVNSVKMPYKVNTVMMLESTNESKAVVAVGGTAKHKAKHAMDAFAIDLVSLAY